MLLENLDIRLEHYSHLSKRKINKALNAKIKYIPSFEIFNKTMYVLGIQQRYKQYASLIIDQNYFSKNKHLFKLNNEFKLSKKTIVFSDDIEQNKFKMPRNVSVEVWTRIKNIGSVNSRTRYLEIAYILNNELFFINKFN